MNSHQWTERAPDYVLGLLEPAAAKAFEDHLQSCPKCRDAVREHREVLAALTAFAPSQEVPPALRSRVLEAASKPPVTPIRPIRKPGRLIPWIAAAASIALTIVAGSGYLRMRAERDSLLAERRAAIEQIDALTIARAERDSLLDAILAADARVATLASAGSEPRLRVFWNESRGVVLMTALDLPAAPPGRAYQLWGIAPDRDPVSLGVFNTDREGTVTLLERVPAGLGLVAAAITEEPEGGSPQPTTQPFLVGEWSGPGA